MTDGKHKVLVEMPEGLHEEFRAAMEAQGQGVAPGIRFLINDWLARQTDNEDFETQLERAFNAEHEAAQQVLDAFNAKASNDRRRLIVEADATYRSARAIVNNTIDAWLEAVENGHA